MPMVRVWLAATLSMVLTLNLVVLPPASAKVDDPVQSPEPRRVQSHSDFNRDGYADLAVGASSESVAGRIDAGAIYVSYGSAEGLSARSAQRWTQRHISPFRPQTSAQFGYAIVAADFDADGFCDLAIGVPGERIGDSPRAGGVHVLRGSTRGLTARRSQFFSQASTGVAEVPEQGDAFGFSLAAGKLGDDPYMDLLVGAPGESIGQTVNAGMVHVINGSPRGLTAQGSQVWSQNSRGIRGGAELNDSFGLALAVDNFAGKAYDDVAIGVPGEVPGQHAPNETNFGAVNVIYGSPRGLISKGNQFWSQASKGIAGTAEDSDSFGSSLAAGHFAGRPSADLAIGVPLDGVGTYYTGAVNVIYGSKYGLTNVGSRLWSQNTRGMPDRSEYDDWFGTSLVAANFGSDSDGRSYDDLAVSVRLEYFGPENDKVGVVHIIYGSSAGLTPRNTQLWSQDSPGIIGEAGNDAFGCSLAAGNFDNDSEGRAYADLAVGATGESDGKNNPGAVNVIYGSRYGLVSQRNQQWTQAGLGFTARHNSAFGFSLAATRN